MFENGIITAPINIKDPYIRMSMGATANGYDLGYICSNMHKRTNKWSKKKPIQYNSVGEISFDTDLTRTAGLVWGMRPPKMEDTDIYFNSMCYSIISGYTEYPNWEYNPPVPGRDWCRLTDFIGYNHVANEPFTTGITNYRKEVNLFDLETINFFFMRNQMSDFTMSEFMGPFTGYHFIVELYVEENEPFYVMSNPTYRFVSKNAIKDMSGWSNDITVNIAGQLDTSKILNKTVCVCMGMQNIQSGNPEPGTGMVAPWHDISDPPFFKMLRFVSYFNRTFEVTAYNFGYVSGGTWYPTYSYQEFSFCGTRPLCFRCRMERKEKGLYILPEHSSHNPPGAKTMFVRGKISGDYSSEQYAAPSNASAQETQYIYVEPSSKGGEYKEFYLLFDSLLKIGRTYSVVFESSVDDGKTWTIINSVSINITCTN